MKYFHREAQKHWITEYGFEECTETIIGLSCQYEACLWHNSGRYNTWVGVDFNKHLVHIYKEYLTGGEIARETIDVSYIDTEEEHEFMLELDRLVDKYMEEVEV